MNQTRTPSVIALHRDVRHWPSVPHKSRMAILIVALVAAMPACASDYSSFLSGMTTSLVIVLAAMNALFIAVFGLSKQYRSRSFANWHAALGSVPPALGLLATLIDAPSISHEAIWFAINGAALGLALLPLWIAKKMARADSASSEQKN